MLKYKVKFYYKGIRCDVEEKECIIYALSTLHLCSVIREMVGEYKLISVELLD